MRAAAATVRGIVQAGAEPQDHPIGVMLRGGPAGMVETFPA
jgi:hypothetical protein